MGCIILFNSLKAQINVQVMFIKPAGVFFTAVVLFLMLLINRPLDALLGSIDENLAFGRPILFEVFHRVIATRWQRCFDALASII